MHQDPTLLTAFRGGEPRALHTVYERFRAPLLMALERGFVLSQGRSRVPGLGDAWEREDVAHEVFVRAFEPAARSAYDGVRPYKPYLLSIARNLAIDRLRQRDRYRFVAPDDVRDLTSGVFPEGVVETYDHRALREAISAFLARQTEEVRRHVELRFFEELSQAEVSSVMGVTRRRVRTLDRQVVSRLREQFAGFESLIATPPDVVPGCVPSSAWRGLRDPPGS